MIRNRNFLIFLCLCVLIVLLVACEPTPPIVHPVQTEGTVHIEGDSVTWNTYWDTGLQPDYATTWNFTPGSAIDKAPWHPNDVTMTRVPKLVSEGKVDTLLWALGLNEIGLEGWSPRYQVLWADMLWNKVPDETCIVIVKPWTLPQDHWNRKPADINALRAWIDNFAADRPNTVVVDWKPRLESSPHFSAADGVHIDAGSGGAESRDAMYREGVARCA